MTVWRIRGKIKIVLRCIVYMYDKLVVHNIRYAHTYDIYTWLSLQLHSPNDGDK